MGVGAEVGGGRGEEPGKAVGGGMCLYLDDASYFVIDDCSYRSYSECLIARLGLVWYTFHRPHRY